jgi:hypothetical protein
MLIGLSRGRIIETNAIACIDDLGGMRYKDDLGEYSWIALVGMGESAHAMHLTDDDYSMLIEILNPFHIKGHIVS